VIIGPMKLIGPDPDLMPAVVRYVEETDGPDLRGAGSRIGDVAAADAVRFLKTIQEQALLHPAPQ
jgi:hypothetical protein